MKDQEILSKRVNYARVPKAEESAYQRRKIYFRRREEGFSSDKILDSWKGSGDKRVGKRGGKESNEG